MKKLLKFIQVPLMLLLLLWPSISLAQIDFRGGEEVDLGTDRFVDDLMVGGAMVEGNIEVMGDTFVAGSMLDLSGTYGDDLNAAGSQVDVAGRVEDNLRVAGANVRVSADVGGNFMMAGANVELEDGVLVEGDAYIAGANVEVRGDVNGNLWVTGARVVLDGEFRGDVTVDAEDVSMSPLSKIGGNFSYTSKEQLQNIVPGQIGGQIDWQEMQEADVSEVNTRGLTWIAGISDFVVGLLMLFVVGLVLVLVVPGLADGTVKIFMKKMGWSFLAGLVVLIVFPVLLVVMLITVIGIPLALILLALYLIVIYLAKIVAALAVGSALLSRKTKKFVDLLLSLGVGLVVYEIIVLIPYLGFAFSMIFVVIGVGAIVLILYDGKWGKA
ncbi:hypothetical protein KJ855_03180 [Patescibacteria group bacterium]|nr:hypothetical protein [Patescibacteria group bacterium]